MNKIFILLFVLSWQIIFSQDVFEVKGKIVSQSSSLQDVNIFNKASAKGTYSDELGNFSIKAAVNDTLIFSAIHLQTFQYVVTKKDTVASTILYIPMESNVKELNELTLIEYKSITTEKLGIVRKSITPLTPAERRLYTAGNFEWYSPLLIPLGGMSVDGMINAISGRTKMLKKEVEVEKRIFLIEELQIDYDKNYLIEKLKIPEDYVNGFYFYLIDQTEFINFYKTKNTIQADFSIAKVAVQYLELIQKKR